MPISNLARTDDVSGFRADPVDAVITWVDGQDPDHARIRRIHAKKSSKKEMKPIPTGDSLTRFMDNGELGFCLRSIRLFAPWIQTIYLVTDGQCPAYLTPEVRDRFNIRIVDHKEIFRGLEWALPTFNSRTIETVLWRIEGLSEKFLYFNDDIFLARPIERTELFQGDRPVLRGHWRRIGTYGPVRLQLNRFFSRLSKEIFGITRSMHHLLQMRSAQLAGMENRYFRVPHLPRPLRLSPLKEFYDRHPGILEKNITHRFRSHDQFSSVFLGSYLDIVQDHAVLRQPTDYTMINGEIDPAFVVRRKINQFEAGDVNFLTLQGVERLRDSLRDELYLRLDEYMNAYDPEHLTRIDDPESWRGESS
ncbi:MAG: Stealth CR1 domain-containing protein [Balneolaceae bacterium]